MARNAIWALFLGGVLLPASCVVVQLDGDNFDQVKKLNSSVTKLITVSKLIAVCQW